MYKKAYVEITNICNLDCNFCHKPSRVKDYMSVANFRKIATEVKCFTDYIYLHVYGEPLLHPNLMEILSICNELQLKVNITTNGSLISEQSANIIAASPRKISFSLHSFEGNLRNLSANNNCDKDDNSALNTTLSVLKCYLDSILDFCDCAKDSGIIIEFRLWNSGGENKLNSVIADVISERLGVQRVLLDNKNLRLIGNIYLGHSEVFNWASDNLSRGNVDNSANYCLGLRDQFGILCDGSVVPCCIDSEGECTLGNIHDTPLAEILSSNLANCIRNNFAVGKSYTRLCLACNFRK